MTTEQAVKKIHRTLSALLCGFLLLFCACDTDCPNRCATSSSQFSVGVFCCDATPPVGHPLCGGWIKPLEVVDDPLYAKGIVLSDGKTRYVICALDWCRLHGGCYDTFREKLAKAANVPVSQVAVQCLHQHNAPLSDTHAQELLDKVENGPPNLNLKFFAEVTDRVADSVRRALTNMRPTTHIGYGKGKVEKFACNRRVKMPDGTILVRLSSMKLAAAKEAPEGLIDPWLRSVTFFNNDAPLVRLHYYASHPQSFYNDGRATSDTVGLARARLEREEGVPQIYFNGCAGDVTAGKYNSGTPADRVTLTNRLYDGMRLSIADTRRVPLTELNWKTTGVVFTPRTEPEFDEATLRKTLEDAKAKPIPRSKAALVLAWYDRLRKHAAVEISALRMGPVTLMHLPGEAFIEYQLYAQSLTPNDFLAVASYGEGGPGYICVDSALAEGGYEPTMSLTGIGSEKALKDGIARLVARDQNAPKEQLGRLPRENLLLFRTLDNRVVPIHSTNDWQIRRREILDGAQAVMGALPGDEKRCPLDMKVEEETDCGSYLRRLITYASEPGSRVPAYLLIPKAALASTAKNFPAVLCLHGTDNTVGHGIVVGIGNKANRNYGSELAERGFVTFAPNYPLLAKYQPDLKQLGWQSGTLKAVWDNMRGLDLLESLPFVKPSAFGAIGHSLGGHNSVFTAVFDPRIKVVVTSCGLDSFLDYYGGNEQVWQPEKGWCQTRYMPRLANYRGRLIEIPFDFHELIGALAPRTVLISAPLKDSNFKWESVDRIAASAREIYDLYGQSGRLIIEHPDCPHDFPDEMREKAYRLLDRELRSSLP